jgi:hypothetical protein
MGRSRSSSSANDALPDMILAIAIDLVVRGQSRQWSDQVDAWWEANWQAKVEQAL